MIDYRDIFLPSEIIGKNRKQLSELFYSVFKRNPVIIELESMEYGFISPDHMDKLMIEIKEKRRLDFLLAKERKIIRDIKRNKIRQLVKQEMEVYLRDTLKIDHKAKQEAIDKVLELKQRELESVRQKQQDYFKVKNINKLKDIYAYHKRTSIRTPDKVFALFKKYDIVN